MNDRSYKDTADRLSGAEDLDEKAAVLWRWDEEDLREFLLFNPDLITFDESAVEGTADPDLRRVVAVAGQPIRGGRDLLLSTAAPGARGDLDGADISLVITTTEHDRRELEEEGHGRPCIKLDLYEPFQGSVVVQTSAREPSVAITYAYIVGDRLPAVGTVLKAFGLAFGGERNAELVIIAREPASVQSVIDEYCAVSEPATIRVKHAVKSGSILGRDTSFFDVLIVDAAPGRLRPLVYELAARGKEVIVIPPAGEADEPEQKPTAHSNGDGFSESDGDPSFGLAAEMLGAARRLASQRPGADPSARLSRTLGPARLARRLRWITQGPLRAIESSGLTGVGWVTRWNVMCGIGDHAAHQIASHVDRHVILAPREEPLLAEDAPNVFRCWDRGLEENCLEQAAQVAYRERLATIVIHFNWAFYHPAELHRFIGDLRSGGRAVILDAHSTRSEGAAHGQRLSHFADCFEACDWVLVHQPADLIRLKSVAPNARVKVEPLGITNYEIDRGRHGRSDKFDVACFGFCLPNKGIEELVLAASLLRKGKENVRLLLLNAEHPAPQSQQTVSDVRDLISRLDLSDSVTFVTDYLDEAECLDLLSGASLIVNPYQRTGESASAAVRFALASTAPVLVTPLPVFDDLGGAVFRARGTSPADLADGIRRTLGEIRNGTGEALDVGREAAKWRQFHDLPGQTARIIGLGESIRRNRRAEHWLAIGSV